MNEKNSSSLVSNKNSKRRKKQSVSSGSPKEITINKKNLIDIVSSWLYATSMIDDDDKVDIKGYSREGGLILLKAKNKSGGNTKI